MRGTVALMKDKGQTGCADASSPSSSTPATVRVRGETEPGRELTDQDAGRYLGVLPGGGD